jgi:hypothetical protein
MGSWQATLHRLTMTLIMMTIKMTRQSNPVRMTILISLKFKISAFRISTEQNLNFLEIALVVLPLVKIEISFN